MTSEGGTNQQASIKGNMLKDNMLKSNMMKDSETISPEDIVGQAKNYYSRLRHGAGSGAAAGKKLFDRLEEKGAEVRFAYILSQEGCRAI